VPLSIDVMQLPESDFEVLHELLGLLSESNKGVPALDMGRPDPNAPGYMHFSLSREEVLSKAASRRIPVKR
jgi:hypothetical protein